MPATAAELSLGIGPDIPAEARVTIDNWQDAPFNRWAFPRVAHLIPSARISRGEGAPVPFESSPHDLASVTATRSTGETWTIEEMLDATFTDAIVVLHRGKLVFERYYNDMTPGSVHLLQSVSKSITGALTGCLAANGQVDLEALVTAYVPEVSESAYAGATVQNLLDMEASVSFSEIYDDPTSEVQTQERSGGWRTMRPGDPVGTHAFLASLRSAGAHGEVFQYCSATTDMLGWVLERATGKRLWDLYSQEIWSKLGVEHDAEITIDICDVPFPNGGISVTARDLARFGQMVLQDGHFNGQQIVPAEWIHETRSGGNRDAYVRSEMDTSRFPNGSYHNKWWIPGDRDGVLYASGIFGQRLHIDPTNQVVIARVASQPEALLQEMWVDSHAAFHAISDALG